MIEGEKTTGMSLVTPNVAKSSSIDSDLAEYIASNYGKEELADISQVWEELNYAEPVDEDRLRRNLYALTRRTRILRKRKIAWIASCVACCIVLVTFGLLPELQKKTFSNAIRSIEQNVASKDVVVFIDDSIQTTSADRMSIISKDNAAEVTLDDKSSRCPVPREKVKIVVPPARTFQLTLDDGTKVYLNSSSQIEYFKGNGYERMVKVIGEAYFEVAKDEKRCFRVNLADDYTVTVLGTRFNVKNYGDGEPSVTTLLQGSVKIQLPETVEENQVVFLHPNEQLVYHDDQMDIRQVDAIKFIAWINRMLYFDSMTLGELAKNLARHYDIVINVDPGIETLRFSGYIKAERGLSHIIRILDDTHGIKCHIRDRVVYMGS